MGLLSMERYYLYNISGWKLLYTLDDGLTYDAIPYLCQQIGIILKCSPIYIQNSLILQGEMDVLDSTIFIDTSYAYITRVYRRVGDRYLEVVGASKEDIRYSIENRIYPASCHPPTDLHGYTFSNPLYKDKSYIVEVR